MKKFWQKIRRLRARNLRAETLLEVIIAVGMISIGAASASNLIIRSINTVSFNRDSLIALNLAQEGIEYMRNLRDTNWIKFSNPNNCWNLLPSVNSCIGASSTDYLNATGEYALADSLVHSTSALDLGNGDNNETFRIFWFDDNYEEDSEGEKIANISRSKKTSETDNSNVVRETQFYRSIAVEYVEISYDESGPTIAQTDDASYDAANAMVITSKVQWWAEGRVNSVVLESALAQYR